MTGSPSPFDASSSALGYLYQCRYALLLALLKGDDPNLCLSIEKLDDVAFHESPTTPTVARECLQFKHKINRAGGLGDSSEDIWKTLKIWAEAFQAKRIDLNRVSLFLVTTTTASDSNAICYLRPETGTGGTKTRKPQDALAVLEAAGAKSKNVVVTKAHKVLMTLTPDERVMLFKAVYLLDAAPSVLDLDQSLATVVRYSVLPHQREGFIQRLEGWWLQRIVRHLSNPTPGVIPISDIQRQLHEIREQFHRDSLPDDMSSAPLPPEAVPTADDRAFVQQLHLIRLPAGRLRNAQEDHYRAFTQRSRWVKDQLIAIDEAERYELRLIDGWKERFAILEECISQQGDEAVLAQHGGKLYDWMSTEAAGHSELWVRSDFKCAYMTRGSYHMLADLLRVGWHPHFAVRLAPAPAPKPTPKPTKKPKGAKP
jgi:hypothetical protein